MKKGDGMKVQEIEISKLKPAKYNPRKISEEELKKLVKSINEYGFVEPIVVNKDMTVIGGHQRLKALEYLEEKTAPCTLVDLTKTQEKALNIALNKISGEFDIPMLKELLTELDDGEFDMDLTGFGEEELEKLLNDSHLDEKEEEEPAEVNSGYIIQYNIIFNDESEQDKWYEFLKHLKDKHPEYETISERLILHINSIL